jgi:NTP pyrophosphatase (non-canonical NTP hydrolase)
MRKKFERGDITQEEFCKAARDELADVQTYLDLLAMRLGINLGEATIDKWNRVSERVGSPVRIVLLHGEQGGCYVEGVE